MRGKRKDSGQVMPLGIIMLLVLLFAAFLFFDIHNVIRGKLKLETAEQSAALTAARWQAKSLNLLGELNLIIATETVLLGTDPDVSIAVPERMEDLPEDSTEERERKKYQRGHARVLALNEMQSRVTFIGPLIAFAAAQQAAKNNGISSISETDDPEGPVNLADDFREYLKRLTAEHSIYVTQDNIVSNGYLWREPYIALLCEIITPGLTVDSPINRVAVRPNGMLMGIEGVQPSYLADASLYRAIMACSKGLNAWCHWRLRQLIKLPDSYFEGRDWYTPDFSLISFSQQSEIYPLEVQMPPDPPAEEVYNVFKGAASGTYPSSNLMMHGEVLAYKSRFYHYNHRWSVERDPDTYTGPVTTEGSPWRRGVFLDRDVADWAIYGGAVAYAECVQNVPGALPFKSAISEKNAVNIDRRRITMRQTGNALVRRHSNATTRVGGNYTLDKESTGCVAKPLGALNGDVNLTVIPIVLPVFERVNLIPSTMQQVRIFSYEWPLIEQFILALKQHVESGNTIFDDIDIPDGAQYMLDALRLLSDKEFRRMGYNPDFDDSNTSVAVLMKFFNKEDHLYHPTSNPRGPGWLQQPMVRTAESMKKYKVTAEDGSVVMKSFILPDEVKKDIIYRYTAEVANRLNRNKDPEKDDMFAVPPDGETWIFYSGKFIKVKGGRFSDIMEDDPYEGCGVMPCSCNCVPCQCKGKIRAGTNNGPERL